MTKFTYRVAWHDSGFIVFRSDGARLPFAFSAGLERRLDNAEVNAIGKDLTKIKGALWKKFYKD